MWLEDYVWDLILLMRHIMVDYDVDFSETHWYPKHLSWNQNTEEYYIARDQEFERQRQRSREFYGLSPVVSTAATIYTTILPRVNKLESKNDSNVIEVEDYENIKNKLLPEFVRLNPEYYQENLIEFILTDNNFHNCTCCKWFYYLGNGVACELYENYNITETLFSDCTCCKTLVALNETRTCWITHTRPLPQRTSELRKSFIQESTRFGSGHKVSGVTIPCRVAGCPDNTPERLVKEAKPTVISFKQVIERLFQRENVSYHRLVEDAKETAKQELELDESDSHDYSRFRFNYTDYEYYEYPDK